MLELRAQAEFCNYGVNLDDTLRDRLVCGINDTSIQRRVLSEHDLMLKKAMEIALEMETAAKNAKSLQGDGEAPAATSGEVLKFTTAKPGGTRQPLPRRARAVGKPIITLQSTNLRMPDVTIVPKWDTSKLLACLAFKRAADKTARSKSKNVKTVQVSAERHSKEYTLFNVPSENQRLPYTVTVEVDEQPLEIDTGASFSVISEATRKQLWPHKRLMPTAIKLRTYSGQPLAVKGSMMAHIGYVGTRTSFGNFFGNNRPFYVEKEF